MSLSWSDTPTPMSPDTYTWGGPHPDGYKWPPGSMQLGAFLVCDVCGSAVSPNATDRHDGWHAAHE